MLKSINGKISEITHSWLNKKKIHIATIKVSLANNSTKSINVFQNLKQIKNSTKHVYF